MSCIRLNLTDQQQTLSGGVHGGVGDAVIAALSAEPESIHELELAVARFVKPIGDWSPFAPLHPGENFEPYDAGVVIVDLAARVVMIDSTYSAPAPIAETPFDDAELIEFSAEQGLFPNSDGPDPDAVPERKLSLERDSPPTYAIRYHDGHSLTDRRLPFRLPDDWTFVHSVPEYKGLCRQRRAAREQIEWFDPRVVLFGKELCEFVAEEILAGANLEAEGLFTEIHAKWLVSPRHDLQDKSPRQWLLAKQEFIDFDLHSRELQWSFTGECPPPLLACSYAYRFAGFGTHELVLYYDLTRLLLDECYKRARQEKGSSAADEIERLELIKSTWLEAPGEDRGKPPALVIELERKRIPLAISGKAAMVDEDCPICREMAEDLETPIFWHLDGCQMDDRFEFSFFKTPEEWEANRRRWEDFNREFNDKGEEREGRLLKNSPSPTEDNLPVQ